MIIKQATATAKAEAFREWVAVQPPITQDVINSYRAKLTMSLNGVSGVSSDELLSEIFVKVLQDMRKNK